MDDHFFAARKAAVKVAARKEWPASPARRTWRHRGTFLLVLLSVPVTGAVLWCGCRSAPVTGRKQILLIPEQQEIAMGEKAYREILSKELPSTNSRYVELVNRVGRRIAAASGRNDLQWEFRVIASPQQNAFALPGGKVAVYEGILAVCRNEAGLAVVMSHEIGHVLARHGGERMTQTGLVQAGQKVAEVLLNEQPPAQRKIILSVYGAGSKYGLILPYSRKHEAEADQIGLMLMAKAGYDPREAPRFWRRFAAAHQGKQPPEFLSTHPSDKHRAENLQRLLPRALRLYEKATVQVGLGAPIPPPGKPAAASGVIPAGATDFPRGGKQAAGASADGPPAGAHWSKTRLSENGGNAVRQSP